VPCTGLLLATNVAAAVVSISLQALFKDKAITVVDGARRVLKTKQAVGPAKQAEQNRRSGRRNTGQHRRSDQLFQHRQHRRQATQAVGPA
jgi:hypothetical protein